MHFDRGYLPSVVDKLENEGKVMELDTEKLRVDRKYREIVYKMKMIEFGAFYDLTRRLVSIQCNLK